MDPPLDLVAIGRVSVDLYGQQVGSRLEDITSFAKAVGGSPANVAIGAARLGLKSALISRVGDEPMGRFVREQLAREGVETRGVRIDSERLTALVLLSVRDAETFPLIFYRENCADAALAPEDIDEGLIASARAVLVTGTHFAGTAAAAAQRKAMTLARTHGRRVILDIDYRPNLWGIGGHAAGESRYARSERVTAALRPLLPDCDLIVGTEEEIHIAAGREDTLEAVREIRACSAAVIVCKRGAKGCVVFAGSIPSSLERALVAPGLDIEVYNVLGAGDAFLAGFLLGYLRDEPHERSARLANACGALAVSRLLCSPEFPSRAELDHLLVHGSAHRALRADPQLSHLHWATTRSAAPVSLYVLGSPGDASRAVEAAAEVAAGRAGFGVRLPASAPSAALHAAQRQGLWVARRV
ncbi:MAG TPA: 5-dehydro-2-deoxygluconokinase, partial [Steroidobacteraceae bacterium]|nr:5-dehydro-2-deoxygluconokinase [Steroidobacteraceae bacterium]